MRVAIACNGTRGDFQPYLSVAVRLQQAGHSIRFYTSSGHVKMAQEFGFPALGSSGDMEEFLRGPDCKKAMEKGDFALCASGIDDVMGHDEERNTRVAADVSEFQPEIIVFNALGVITTGAVFCAMCPEVPRINVELQPQAVASNAWKASAFQRPLPDKDTPNIMTYFWTCFSQDGIENCQKIMNEKSKEEVLQLMDYQATPESSFESIFEPDKWLVPRFLAYSPSFWPPVDDWPKSDNLKVLGNFKLSKAIQDEYTQKGCKYFSVGSDYAKCQDFIAKVGPPVYIGWGSMVVYTKQHMTLLAVKALKRAGEKGIILGGWALIGLDGLEGAEDEEELRAWCEENVLFIKAAPHELLFPQCKAAVHHGGIGTLQVSISSGCPTIITPVFADQFDNAKHLKSIECGTSTTKLGKLKFEELGDAIKTLCSDPKYKTNAQRLGEAMVAEDGVTSMVTWLEKFYAEEVQTGLYVKRRQEDKERLYNLRLKNNKLDFGRMNSKYQSVLMSRYPSVKEWNGKNMAFMAKSADLVSQGKLWLAECSVLAREGEGLKTPEAGRFRRWAWLEEVEKDQKGTRVHVKRLQGRGPDEGWVSTTVKGKSMLKKIDNAMEIGMLKQMEFMELFSDVMQKKPPEEED